MQTEVDLTGYANVGIEYSYRTDGKEVADALWLRVSNDGGSSWSAEQNLPPSDAGHGLFQPSGIADAAILLRFENRAPKKARLFVEDVVVRGDSGCGNGIIQDEESCDSGNLGGESCASLGLGEGLLQCDAFTCTLDTSMCTGGGTGGSGGTGGGGTGG